MLERPAIAKILSEAGIDLFGVADIENADLGAVEVSGKWPRALVIGYVLSREVMSTVTDRPSIIYKHHYKTVNWILDQAAERLAHTIEKDGRRSIAIPASQTVDRQHRKGHLSHRVLGFQAGLGFQGRSGLLINPRYGARVRYATVLTDLNLAPDRPIEENCGDCHLCVLACPAGAISETGVDLEKCAAQLNAFAALPGIGQNICGICIKACMR